ncbi:hypothetical protein F511_29958 [Dorcoceras hygrometricum]|uniref:Uncharacterized protein n=1 Tax=Dorcoceras hygrometricum TaxID=472368 RepID=A0A2Z7A1B4_9LAMI|nr:hypothetical protein F511_29958 [Dorcoceras hygrometricum]
MIPALTDQLGHLLVGGARLGQQHVQFLVAAVVAACVLVGELRQGVAVAAQQLAAVGRAVAERIHALVVPARQHVLRAVGHGQDVDADVVGLADAVEAADALLQQVGIQRQVPQHQPVRELEVAALRTDLRTQQQARAVGLGEVCRVAVALHDAQALVEARDAGAAARAQRFLQRQHLGLAAADQQELVLRMRVEQGYQRVEARIVRVVVFQHRRRLLDVGVELGMQGLAGGFVEAGGLQHLPLRNTLGKTADAGAAIAEHRAAGAVAVDQRGEDLARMLGFGGVGEPRFQRGVAGEGAAQRGELDLVQRLTVQQLVGDPRQRLEAPGLGEVGVQVVVALRVEQAQAGEVAAAAQLFGCGGEQDHAGCLRGQPFHQGVARAGRLGRPGEVMRLVHHQQVPRGVQQLLRAFRVRLEEGEVGDHRLLVLERVAGVCIPAFFRKRQRLAALLVVDRETEVEAAQQLDEPLVDQGVRQQQQHARGAAGGELARHDHAGLDGLAQAHLVGQQHARRPARSGDAGHAQLVRHQADARGAQAPGRRTARLGAAAQALHAQLELRHGIGAPADQAVVGLAHALLVVELALVQLAALAAVDQQLVLDLHPLHQEGDALAGHALAGAELGAHQRRGIGRIGPQHPGLGEQHLHAASLDAQHGAEAELGLGSGDPALTRYEHCTAAWVQGPSIIRVAGVNAQRNPGLASS